MKLRRRLILAVLLPFAFHLAAAAARTADAQLTENGRINYRLVPNLEPMNEKRPAPDFTLPMLSAENPSTQTSWWRRWWSGSAPAAAHQTLTLKDFRGNLVLLNFWASWCEPCREEMPAMERLYREFQEQGFVVLAVSLKDNQKEALSFVKEFNLTYPIGFDPEGKAGILYGAWGLPTTYLIGPDGVALARLWGPADWHGPGARKLVQTLLEQKR